MEISVRKSSEFAALLSLQLYACQVKGSFLSASKVWTRIYQRRYGGVVLSTAEMHNLSPPPPPSYTNCNTVTTLLLLVA